jgi:hypothetical protein
MRVVVLTSDKYLPALRVFAWLFNKYWSPKQEVVVGGFTPPDFDLPANFTFHSIGHFADYPVDKWSNGVIKLLQELPDDVITLMLEDYWLIRPVNTEAVRIAADYAQQFGYVLRIDLTTDRLFAGGPHYPSDIPDYGFAGYLDLFRKPDTPYEMSLIAGVWRKDNLLSVLVPGESPWDVEIAGTTRVNERKDLLVLGTRQWPVRHILGLRNGNHGDYLLDGLSSDDVTELRRLGYLPAETA